MRSIDALRLRLAGMAFALAGLLGFSTQTDIANLTTTITSLLVALIPLVVILLVVGFIFGMLAGKNGIFARFERE